MLFLLLRLCALFSLKWNNGHYIKVHSVTTDFLGSCVVSLVHTQRISGCCFAKINSCVLSFLKTQVCKGKLVSAKQPDRLRSQSSVDEGKIFCMVKRKPFTTPSRTLVWMFLYQRSREDFMTITSEDSSQDTNPWPGPQKTWYSITRIETKCCEVYGSNTSGSLKSLLWLQKIFCKIVNMMMMI